MARCSAAPPIPRFAAHRRGSWSALETSWRYRSTRRVRGGRYAEAADLLDRLRAVHPQHPRIAAFQIDVERALRHDRVLAEAQQAIGKGSLGEAESRLRQVAAESPTHPALRNLQQQIIDKRPAPAMTPELGPDFHRPVTLEFRDAPLRTVFEALARGSSVNFVFDKDVRAESRVTVFLKNVTIDEAMRVVLSTQQLDRKILNQDTVLIFPNTTGKQREHQDLVTRSIYLTNADVKQAQTLVRSIAKTRDMFIDERLGLLVIRDTAEVVRLVEGLIATLDLPEPEVVLDVEVLEVTSARLDELGVQWPEQVRLGLPDVNGVVPLSRRSEFAASVANPAAVATLRGNSGTTNLLANPKLRARNREKAKVQIGEKLPVFTTTSTTNVGVSTSVSYLDVGLKLEVEPSVQLDNEVVMKVNLDVSSLIRQVNGPQGAVAYQIGTRNASTSLRLRDGETQILAGLISDEDRKNVAGIPGASLLPVIGRLFGLHSDTRNKTEVVLLITPRVVRSLSLPDASLTRMAAGTDALPGNFSTQLRPQARAAVGTAAAAGRSVSVTTEPAAAQVPSEARLILEVTPHAKANDTVSVSLKLDGSVAVQGEIEFDPKVLQDARADPEVVGNGRIAFDLKARGERVVVLRVAANAQAGSTNVSATVTALPAIDGATPSVKVEGDGTVSITAAKSP